MRGESAMRKDRARRAWRSGAQSWHGQPDRLRVRGWPAVAYSGRSGL